MALDRKTPFEVIDAFIAEIDDAQSLDRVVSALNTQVKRLGFDYFTYWLIWPPEGPRKPLYFSKYPWAYVAKRCNS